MAKNYIEIYSLRYDTELRARVEVAVAKAALDVVGEPGSGDDWIKRQAWASDTLSRAPQIADQWMWAVVSNAVVQSEGGAVADSDLQWIVNQLVAMMVKSSGGF